MTDDEEFLEALRAEMRTSRWLARQLADAFGQDDPEILFRAADMAGGGFDVWRLALLRVGRMTEISEPIRDAFLAIWIESKMLPARVEHRPTMAKALRVLMPRAQKLASGEPLRLYRGASATERRRRVYGFSWTTDAEIAKTFATHWQKGPAGGVVLETLASRAPRARG